MFAFKENASLLPALRYLFTAACLLIRLFLSNRRLVRSYWTNGNYSTVVLWLQMWHWVLWLQTWLWHCCLELCIVLRRELWARDAGKFTSHYCGAIWFLVLCAHNGKKLKASLCHFSWTDGESFFFWSCKLLHVILLLSMKQLGSPKRLACTPLIGSMKGVRCLEASVFEDVVRDGAGMTRYLMTFVIRSFD